MRGPVVVGSAVLLLLVLVGPAAAAPTQGATTWFTWSHAHLPQRSNGAIQGDFQPYGWSIRHDFPGPFSLTLNYDVGFLTSLSLETFFAKFVNVTAHYRLDLPRE